MSEPAKAVFLSYASQDAAAARKICDALRAAGIEVWFDQSELVGGDAWDAKIRQQIKECALFLPIISANTQARAEGYFRIEWRLADRRTEAMGKSKAFLVPISIDDTRDSGADVPDSFLAVQWTRLPAGETNAAFCERVRKLLGAEGRDASPRRPVSISVATIGSLGETSLPSTASRRVPVSAWIAAAVVSLAVIVWLTSRRHENSPQPAAVKTPAVTSSDLARARARIQPDRWQKQDFDAISATLDRLIQANQEEADAWALRSIINSLQVMRNFDSGTKPLEIGKSAAERALRLAPNSPLGELALGMHLAAMFSRGNDVSTARPHIERGLAGLPRDALTRYADLTSCWLGYQFEETRRTATTWLQEEPRASFPAWILAQMHTAARQPDEAETWANQAVAADNDITSIRSLVSIFEARYYLRADLPGARAALARLAVGARPPHRLLYARWLLAMAERQWDQALQEIARVPEPIFFDRNFHGPKALLLGLAHQAAGRTEPALAQFRESERLLRAELAPDPDNEELRAVLAVTLASAGRTDDARSELAAIEPLMRGRAPSVYTGGNIALIAQAYGAIGDVEKMIPWLRKLLAEPSALPFTPASLKFDPRFSSVIAHPAVQALLVEFAHLDAKKSAAVGVADPKAIAVLPFENLSGEPDSAGFADGMHEEVLTAVAKVAALTVIGRTSVLPYRDAAKRNLRAISTELSVGTIVEGTVRRAGNRVRIAVKLVDAQTSRQLWSDSFEHELTDVFAIQVAVAEKIAATLKATFTAGERTTLERRPTQDARAYESYLQAKLLNNDLNSTTPLNEWERAVQLLGQAIAADPGFAQAHALLARTHASISWHGTLDPSPARRELARQALANAQRLAPTAPETRFAEGRFLYTSNRDFDAAMASYKAALLELPNDSELLYHIGITERQLGRLPEATASLTRGHQLNPLDISTASDLTMMLLMLRRFAASARIGERYSGQSATLRSIVRATLSARYEIDGDKARFLAGMQAAPTWGNDPAGLIPMYQAAFLDGNLSEANSNLLSR